MLFKDNTTIDEINLDSDIKLLHKGKVRNIYQIDDDLLIVSTDRISAFDVVFPNGIPQKGKILNLISNQWFSDIDFIKNHLIETDVEKFPKKLHKYKELLKNRSVICKKCKRIDFECIVRGYLIGNGWKEYSENGEICGIKLPEGLKLAQKLPHPIFTPTTKADKGHDENIPFSVMEKSLGPKIANKIKDISIKIYEFAYQSIIDRGIIIADTKFEFGIDNNGDLILIDEVLTPDSSRFWSLKEYKIGTSPVSFDKQFVRDYLESISWDKKPPAPFLPESIVSKTKEKYIEAYNIITQSL